MPGYSDSEAAELARELQNEWAATNVKRDLRRQLRQRKLDPSLPPGWSKNTKIMHHTYEIDDSAIVLRNRLVAAEVSIRVFAKSGKVEAQQAASRIRRVLDKVWLNFNSGYPSAHFLGTDAQVADGVWPAHVAWDQGWIDAALEAEDIDTYLRNHGFPFVLETHDPLNVFMEMNRIQHPRRVVTIEKVVVGDLMEKQYRDAGGDEYYLNYDKDRDLISRSSEPASYDDRDRAYGKTVEIASVEDGDFVHRVLMEGDKGNERALGLGKWDNLFGRPAWVFMAGDFSNSTDPLERWKPIILGMYSMGNELNMLRSARLNSGMLTGLPRIMMQKDPDKGFGPVGPGAKPELEFGEDGVVWEPDGWKAVPFEFPKNTAEILDRAITSVEMEANSYKPAAALTGAREEGVSSGYQQTVIADAAMTRLDPPLAIQSQGIKDILGLVLDGARAIDKITDHKIDTLYVRTLNKGRPSEGGNTSEVLELKASEIDDFEITVHQDSMSPTTRITIIEEGRRARMAGEIDDITFYEDYCGYEDGVEMQNRAIKQKVRNGLVEWVISKAIEASVALSAAQVPPTILGPTGNPITSAMYPPQAGGVPSGSASPGVDATLAQPQPPAPAPMALQPQGGTAGMVRTG
jgi:hypothetical protein